MSNTLHVAHDGGQRGSGCLDGFAQDLSADRLALSGGESGPCDARAGDERQADGGAGAAESEAIGEDDSVAEERAENEGMPCVRPKADDES